VSVKSSLCGPTDRKPRTSIGISGVFQHFGKPLGNLRFCLRTAKRRVGKRDFLPSIVLALKLAEADILYRKTGERPVILLDDVMSELDMSRRDYLLNHLDGRQVFITCCDSSRTTTPIPR